VGARRVLVTQDSTFVQCILDGAVARCTLNRPERRNALTPSAWAALGRQIADLDADPAVRAIVLTGAGDAFCAGFDLDGLSSEDPAAREQRLATQSTFIGMLPPHDTPIIGAVNGPAVTGGLELALSCDVLVASPNARFADTHTRVGAVPGGGLTILLPRRIGPGRARLLSLTGTFIDAETALAWGLVDLLVEADALLPRTLEIGREIAALPEAATAEIRSMYDRFADRSDAAAFAEEQAAARAWMVRQFDQSRLARERDHIVADGRIS